MYSIPNIPGETVIGRQDEVPSRNWVGVIVILISMIIIFNLKKKIDNCLFLINCIIRYNLTNDDFLSDVYYCMRFSEF